MARLLELARILPGAAILVGTWIMFLRLRPREGVIHPLVKSDRNLTLILFGFVGGTAFGLAMIVSGIAGFLRPG